MLVCAWMCVYLCVCVCEMVYACVHDLACLHTNTHTHSFLDCHFTLHSCFLYWWFLFGVFLLKHTVSAVLLLLRLSIQIRHFWYMQLWKQTFVRSLFNATSFHSACLCIIHTHTDTHTRTLSLSLPHCFSLCQHHPWQLFLSVSQPSHNLFCLISLTEGKTEIKQAHTLFCKILDALLDSLLSAVWNWGQSKFLR